jgi:ATP-dependent DNA helicase RecG
VAFLLHSDVAVAEPTVYNDYIHYQRREMCRMEAAELLRIISRGEDSRNQFKADITNAASLAAEIVAFSNMEGGRIFVGVGDGGEITGLSRADVSRLNALLSNAASQLVRPPVNPLTENIETPAGLVMVVTVDKGIAKPYMDNSGAIWVKSGADKRRVTSREEMQRMFQSSSLIYGDEVPVHNLTLDALDMYEFRHYIKQQYGDVELEEGEREQWLHNLNLMRDGVFNVAGALLFTHEPERRLPAFVVKCASFPGTDIHTSQYADSEDIAGALRQVFKDTLAFVSRNLLRLQKDKSVNSVGEMEIPKVTLEELIINALVHRDYFVSAPVRVFVFGDRVEIVSPGHLPNNLTVEHIKNGNSNIRNPILASFAAKMLPYRGLGTGIRRALKEHPHIDFVDDRDGNLFRAIIYRA